MFRWILDTLRDVEYIDTILINTDARKILEDNGLFEDEKIKFRDRKKEICGDLVSMNVIIEDDINNSDGDIYLMTHTTNPFLSKNTIKKAIIEFQNILQKQNRLTFYCY